MRAKNIPGVKLPGYPVDWLVRILGASWLPLIMTRAILRPSMASGRGRKMPSLHLDLASGRNEVRKWKPSTGRLLKLGKNLGIATPVNRALTTILGEYCFRSH